MITLKSFRDLDSSTLRHKVFGKANAALDKALKEIDAEEKAEIEQFKKDNNVDDRLGKMRILTEAYARNDYKTCISTLRDFSNLPHLTPGLKPSIIKLSKILQFTISDKKTDQRHQEWIETLSDMANMISQGVETIHTMLDTYVRHTVLPSSVVQTKIVENSQIVVSATYGVFKTNGLKQIIKNIFLADVTLVGVYRSENMDKNYQRANAQSMLRFQKEVTPLPLVRPDSDGVWFAIFDGPLIADSVQFPENMRREYGSGLGTVEEANVQLRLRRNQLKDRRQAFEHKNSDMFERLALLQRKLSDHKALVAEKSEKFLALYGKKPNKTSMAKLQIGFEEEKEELLSKTEFSAIHSLRIIRDHRRKVEKCLELYDEISVLAQGNTISFREIKLLQSAIAEQRELERNPHMDTLRKFQKLFSDDHIKARG